MKRYIIISLLLLGILNVQAQNKQLVVLHTNDTHSTILPLNPNLADTMTKIREHYNKLVADKKVKKTKTGVRDTDGFLVLVPRA